MDRSPFAPGASAFSLLLVSSVSFAQPPLTADAESLPEDDAAAKGSAADKAPRAAKKDAMEAIEVEVRGEPRPPGETISRETLWKARYSSTGEALAELPGVWVVRRGAGAAEPTIRGLGWERVVTQVGLLPLYGACPGRMDPPVTYLRPHAVHELSVVQGIPSVTLGPSTTGGRVVVRPDYERPDDADRVEGWSGWKVDSSRSGMTGDGGLRGGLGPLDFALGAEAARLGDYRSPSGAQIPARHAEWSASGSVAYQPSRAHRLWHALSYVRHDEMSYPALPMDLARTDYWQSHLGYRYRGDQTVREVSLELGLMDADHEMSNRGKPNRRMLLAHTASTSRAFSGRATTELSLGHGGTLRTGVDTTALERDALRSRDLQPTGRHFEDPLWPDALQTQQGLFAEWTSPRLEGVELRAGGRIDSWHQRARKVDDPGLGGRSVREGYGAFYGAEAMDVDRTDVLGGANGALQWTPQPGLRLELGGGWSSRIPSITERYFSFAPAPGGFLVGNPSLEPERKIEINGAVHWASEWLGLALSGHSAWIGDYVLPTALARMDVNGDGQPDTIRGFRNVDARLIGGEARAVGQIGRHVSIPTSAAVVYGQNQSDGRPLPEIPPWELTGALQLDLSTPVPWWVRFGIRVLGEQDRVDEHFPEDPTEAFALLHLRAGIRLFEQLELGLDVENLLDTEYHEHLTRELVFATDGLPAGSELPAPGRSLFVSGRWLGVWHSRRD